MVNIIGIKSKYSDNIRQDKTKKGITGLKPTENNGTRRRAIFPDMVGRSGGTPSDVEGSVSETPFKKSDNFGRIHENLLQMKAEFVIIENGSVPPFKGDRLRQIKRNRSDKYG
jgi:hypothetical protein